MPQTTDLTRYSSPYGEGSPKRGDQNQSILAAALRGLLGKEETGSVLDPATAQNKAVNSKTNLVSILSDILPVKGGAGAGMAMAGALRRGGRPDLFLSHGASATGLMKNGKLLTELTHPSFAITKNRPNAPWGDVMLIPREGKFDPKTSGSVLRDMDFWTPSHIENTFRSPYHRNQYNDAQEVLQEGQLVDPNFENPGVQSPVKPGFISNDAQARLVDKFANRFPKGGLNAAGSEAMGSNSFHSFESFENATRGGARRLESGKPIAQKHLEWLGDTADAEGMQKPEVLQALLTDELGHGEKGVEYGRKIMKSLRQTPQDYAEVKQYGHVPLTADNFAGVLAKEGTPQELINALRERGLHVKEYDPHAYDILQDHGVVGQYADELQRLSRESMTPVPGSKGMDALPEAMPYDKVVETLRQKERLASQIDTPMNDLDMTPTPTPGKIDGGPLTALHEGKTFTELLKLGMHPDDIANLPGFGWLKSSAGSPQFE